MPSARAVRFYVANRLLDRPEGSGTAATYGYRHLLQLLAIKIRQREGQTLDAIKAEMRETTGDALERRVAVSLAPALTIHMDPVAQREGNGVASWRRVPVADGIELHVRDDSPASRDELLAAMRESLRAPANSVLALLPRKSAQLPWPSRPNTQVPACQR